MDNLRCRSCGALISDPNVNCPRCGRPPAKIALDNELPEAVIWEGTPSAWQLLIWWILIVTIPYALYRLLVLRFYRIRITTERIVITHGILNQATETNEHYRIRDMSRYSSFFQRIFGCGDIHFETNDTRQSTYDLRWIPDSVELMEQLRIVVERCRARRNVRILESGGIDDDEIQ